MLATFGNKNFLKLIYLRETTLGNLILFLANFNSSLKELFSLLLLRAKELILFLLFPKLLLSTLSFLLLGFNSNKILEGELEGIKNFLSLVPSLLIKLTTISRL